MTDVLHIAEGVDLPIDFVTKTAAIMAQRRKGKTYTAAVIAEELVAARIPFVALDPTGAWWGLRASADGESAGLPVIVIGGQHGDLPLERDAGRVVADLVLDHPGYYVLDLSLLGSRKAERDFATAFGDRLHRRKMEPGMDFPLHLFIDEADMFVPQEREGAGDNVLLGVYAGIVRRGGLAGLGSTLISQRPALVNKHALSQIDILIALRLVSGIDQKALYDQYVKNAGTKEQQAELMDSLASLPVGEAWFWEPGAEPPLYVRVKVRERHTFNSSATPKPGEQRVEPRVLADVDLAGLRDKMAGAIERARDEDPAALRQQIGVLRGQLSEKDAALDEYGKWGHDLDVCDGPSAVEAVLAAYMIAKQRVGFSCDVVDEVRALESRPAESVEVPVPVFPAPLRDAIRADFEAMVAAGDDLAAAGRARLEHLDDDFGLALELATGVPVAASPEPEPPAQPLPAAAPTPAPPPPAGATIPTLPAEDPAEGLTRPQQKVLDSIAWWNVVGVQSPTRLQVALVAGYAHPQSRGFREPLYSLKAAGLIDYPLDNTAALTEAGTRLARRPSRAPTEPELHLRIYQVLSGVQEKMLRMLIDGRHAISRDDLAAALGYAHAQSRGFREPLYRLHKLGLIEYPSTGTVMPSRLCYLT
ncbi:MAG: ATP-binding protein [Myxococcales bacterium]